MNNNDQPDKEPENPFAGLPPGATLDHVMSDAQLDALAPLLITLWEADYEDIVNQLRADATASATDDATLRHYLRLAKATEAQLGEWIDRLGDRATDKLKDLLRQFGRAAEDIAFVLNTPPDGDPGDASESA